MTTTTTRTSARTTERPLLRATGVAALVAAALTTLLWLVGQATPASWEVTQGGQTQQILAVMPAVASVIGIVAGAVGLWVLARFRWGVTAWTVLAVVVGLGSSASPLAAAEDTWTGVLLAAMHVIVLAVALVVLRPAARRA